jgi:hypothetical protein
MDVAEAGGYLVKPNVGWYEAVNPATGEVLMPAKMRAKEIHDNNEFWLMMFEKTDFATYIKNSYTMANGPMLDDQTNVKIEEVLVDD